MRVGCNGCTVLHCLWPCVMLCLRMALWQCGTPSNTHPSCLPAFLPACLPACPPSSPLLVCVSLPLCVCLGVCSVSHIHSEEERSKLLVSLSTAQRQLQHLHKQHTDSRQRMLEMQAGLASGDATAAPAVSAADIAAAQGDLVRDAVSRETAEVRAQMEGVLTDNALLRAKLDAAEAALAAVDRQREELTAERSAWLDQLQQENAQLSLVYEEARQAKRRLVREMNELAKQREDMEDERLEMLQQAAEAQDRYKQLLQEHQHQQHQQRRRQHEQQASSPLALRDAPDSGGHDVLGGAGAGGEGGVADGAAARVPGASSSSSSSQRVQVDGLVVEIRNADAIPGPMTDQGAVELLARHQVEAFKANRRAQRLEQAAEEAKRRQVEAEAEAESAREQARVLRDALEAVRGEGIQQKQAAEDALREEMKKLESKNRLLMRSMNMLKERASQLRAQNAQLAGKQQ